MRILVVDDHPEVRDLVTRALERDGHVVTAAGDLSGAREALAASTMDVMVLDLGLPDGSGLELCREVRAEKNDLPILVLTAQSAVSLRVQGLDAGADDYLAKPFAIAELRARVRALARRGRLLTTAPVRGGDLLLDLAGRKAERAGAPVALTAREWAIIEFLGRRNKRVATKEEILDGVWGEDDPGAAASLEVLIGRLRKKLGRDVIRTLRGEGYALQLD